MQFFLLGPRLFGGLLRPGASFSPAELRNFIDGALGGTPGASIAPFSFVYVVSGAAGNIKVGVSGDPLGRLAQLQTGSPFPLQLAYVAAAPGDCFGLERAAHRIISRYGVSGEWFTLPVDMAVAAIHAAAYRRSVAAVPIPLADLPRTIEARQKAWPAIAAATPKPFPKAAAWALFIAATVAWIWLVRAVFISGQ